MDPATAAVPAAAPAAPATSSGTRAAAAPGIRAVVARELAHFAHDPWDLAMLAWVPLATMALVLWLFSAGLPVGLPIAVVDEDHSPAARDVGRRIAATRSVTIAAYPASLAEAWPLVRSRAVYGVVHIPPNWEREAMRGVVQPVVFYDNAQYYLVAGLVGNDIRAAVTSGALGQLIALEAHFGDGFAAAAGRVQVVGADLRSLFNPTLSYEAYLGGVLLPAILHLFATVAAVAALGREFRDRTVGAWLDAAGGSLGRALAGKLVPVLGTYLVLAALLIATLAGWRGWTPVGSLALWYVALATLMATGAAIALMFVGATANLRMSLSFTGIYVATAVAFSGATFPLVSMGPAAQWWASLLPYAHYLPVQQGQWLAGASPSSWAAGMGPLLLFVAAPTLIGWPLLARAARTPERWGGR